MEKESEVRIQWDLLKIVGMLEYWNDGMMGPVQPGRIP